MALVLEATPEKTIENILSNVAGARSQLPYTFQSDNSFNEQNYKVAINIYEDDGVTPLIAQAFLYSPDPTGKLFVDIGLLLTELHESSFARSISYVLGYTELYDGFEGVEVLAPVIQSIYAEKQLLAIGGSNLWNYLLREINGIVPAGLPLTVYRNPFCWKGFHRSATLLVDSNVVARNGDTAKFAFYEADINKQRGGASAFTSVSTVGVHPVTIPESVKNGSFVEVRAETETSGDPISQSVFYEVQNGCENDVYVGWVNSKGGTEQFLFSFDHLTERTVEQGLLTESVINADIENVNRTKGRFPNIWNQQMILTAEHQTKDQLIALAEIKQSDFVVVYLEPNDPANNVFVIVSNDYTATYNTRNALHDFSLQIEFPDNFDYFKAIPQDPPSFILETLIDSNEDILIDSDLDNLIG